MRPVVFAGPTIGAPRVLALLDGAEVRPPVAQGDVYRAVRSGPSAIGIIDGYFDGVPSVWHKEILWAMEQGIPVFGSASMGALRAAELDAFGMVGVGAIYEDYRDGRITDDDEVAVLHGPAELGFVALSEPMVSVRATVARARDAGVLDEGAAARVTDAAKALHYRDRTWEAVAQALDGDAGVAAFLDWLPQGRLDAKRADAEAMLQRMQAHLDAAPAPITGPERVERTLVWQGLVRRIEAETPGDGAGDAAGAVLDELRLTPDRYEALRQRALLRGLALDEAARAGTAPGRDALTAEMDRHRRAQGLSRRATLMAWLEANDLDAEGYEALLAEAAQIAAAADARAGALDAHILSELRWSGEYAALKARAEAKARDMPGADAASPDRLRLMVWYFETRLGRAVPDDPDAYARRLGLADRGALLALIAREFMYDPGAGPGAAG